MRAGLVYKCYYDFYVTAYILFFLAEFYFNRWFNDTLFNVVLLLLFDNFVGLYTLLLLLLLLFYGIF